MTFDCRKTQCDGYDTRRNMCGIAFANFIRRVLFVRTLPRAPLPPPLPSPRFPPRPFERVAANHYSKRIMQTRDLIKNIFVFAWSSLLHTDIYRAISSPVVTQNPQLIALIRRDCARGRTNLHARCCANEFSISRASPRPVTCVIERSLIIRTLAQLFVTCIHALAERITNKTTKD